MFKGQILLLIFLHANSAYSQHTSANEQKSSLIRGIVTDSLTRRPIGSVTLMLSAEGKGIVRTATTLNDGKFAFPVAGKGTYRLDISMVGYKKYISPMIRLTSDTTIGLDTIKLKRETGMLNEVIVQNRRRKSDKPGK